MPIGISELNLLLNLWNCKRNKKLSLEYTIHHDKRFDRNKSASLGLGEIKRKFSTRQVDVEEHFFIGCVPLMLRAFRESRSWSWEAGRFPRGSWREVWPTLGRDESRGWRSAISDLFVPKIFMDADCSVASPNRKEEKTRNGERKGTPKVDSGDVSFCQLADTEFFTKTHV